MDSDTDAKDVARQLRAALCRSGLSLRGFAAALGTSHSRLSSCLKGTASPSAAFFLRALRQGAALGEADARGWMTPQSTRQTLKEAIAQGDDRWAFKVVTQARDQVRAMLAGPGEPVAAWETRPSSTGEERWDGLLAALIAHEFAESGRTPPAWTAFRAVHEWVLPNLLLDETAIREATPEWLAERGIYIARRDLITA
ncbi:helix-turn-helix domain-containing protein [Nocardioides sp. Root190]|uniref:helix-turn-helix domain-containing protein n=1 Tax=Nocardioides sp. Root190 TaxID=1736488 RepID=UPI000AEFC6B2|nr:helix-turn-helix transcriptional regulator [Nocardioides sp. Root190]